MEKLKFSIFSVLLAFTMNAKAVPVSVVPSNSNTKLSVELIVASDFQKSFKNFLRLDQYTPEELNDELFKRLMTASLAFFSTIVLMIILFFQQRKIRRKSKLLKESHALISAQKEELDKMIKTRDHLFSIIGHDLRGPVGNVSVMLEFLSEELKDKLDEKDKQSLLELYQVSERTLYLLENLFRWASLQRNSIHIKIEANDLIEIIDEVIGLIKTPASLKEINIRKETPASINAVFDKDMMLLVLRNLLVNAMKFSNEGGTIVIKTEEKGDQVLLTIKDDGIGMTEDEIAMILNPSMYYSKTGTKDEPGSGLGLKLCQDFIRRNGGELSIMSKLGDGSEFSFSLPLAN